MDFGPRTPDFGLRTLFCSFTFKIITMQLRIVISLSVVFLAIGLFAQNEPYTERQIRIYDEIGENLAIIKNSGRDYVLPMDINWNYYYLTGDESEGAILLMNGRTKTSTIYKTQAEYRRRMPDNEANNLKDLKDFNSDLMLQLGRTKTLWIDYSSMVNLEELGQRMQNLESINNLAPIIHNMRKIKDEHEMELLSYAIETTAAGLREVMKAAEPGMNEKDFELILKYKFQKADCEHLGFGIQAASGPNATHVHYGNNDRQTEKGDMMVFDVGARFAYYTADISRSFPVSGKFTKEQKEIYGLVLKAQKAAINTMKKGVNIQIPANNALDVLNEGLFELGLITDSNSGWQKRFWIQHGFFHHIGLVVHDVGGYGGILEPGMIITMEPGLYFPADYLESATRRFSRSVDSAEIDEFIKKVKPIFNKYINIGVRIEDDVYITENGNKVISKGVPKEIDEIEKLMKETSLFNN